MIPGGARNPRQLELAMRRLGMTTEEVPDVEEVVIRTRQHEHVFQAPEVTILTVQGVRTYQVVGTPHVRPRSAPAAAAAVAGSGPAPAAPAGPPEDDGRRVLEQANVSRAEAILRILTRGER